MCDKCSGSVEKCLEMSREVDRFNRKAHAEKVRNFYRDQGREQEQQRITELVQSLGFVWMGAKQNLEISRDDLIDLINKTSEQGEEINE